MVEAAEGHETFPVATTIIDDDPLLELAIFDALDWSDMWDDVCCSGCIPGTWCAVMLTHLVSHRLMVLVVSCVILVTLALYD